LLGRRLPALVAMFAEKIPLFVLSLLSGVVTLFAQSSVMAPITGVTPGFRVMNAVVAYVTYLRETIAPVRLTILHPLYQIDFYASFLPSLLILAIISVVVLARRKRWPWLLFGWLWFLLMLLPVIGLVQVGNQSHADRYMYLPSIGLFLALGASLARLDGKAMTKALLALAPVLVFYSFIAWIQVGYWSGSYMLFTRSLAVAGESIQSRIGLSGFYLRHGQLREAEEHALKGLAASSDSALAYTNLGDVLAAKKDYLGAEQMYRKALIKSPGNAWMLNNLGIILELQGRPEEARHFFASALKSDPQLYGVKENLKRVGG
jgi:tetratricopeptide (TPR) repeat protein